MEYVIDFLLMYPGVLCFVLTTRKVWGIDDAANGYDFLYIFIIAFALTTVLLAVVGAIKRAQKDLYYDIKGKLDDVNYNVRKLTEAYDELMRDSNMLRNEIGALIANMKKLEEQMLESLEDNTPYWRDDKWEP